MRRGRALGAVAVVALAVTAGLVTPAPAAPPPGVAWTEYLPALPSPSQTHPNRVAHCKRAKLRCVRVQIRRMRELQARLGCDHRAVFATTYLELTRGLRDALLADPGMLAWPKFFFREDALFANVYFRSVRHYEQGREVPEAWRIAFETARSGEVTAAQDMLLGINAHVQNDMPFVLARLGLRDRQGRSRKPDHDLTNEVLASSYDRVVGAVRERYDPGMAVTNPPGVPVDDVAGLEIVREWRERVWRNAERLVNAESEAERARVAAEIEAYAADWARGIAAMQTPGYRAERDAYCAQQLAG
jgi:hypothetical protein